MVESLETILKAESSPEYFILSFNETNDLLSLFCMQKRRIHAKGHPCGVFYYEFFQKRKGGR